MLPETEQQPELCLADLFRGDLQLASPPNIYFELKKTMDDPAKTIADAGKILENDPSLTIRLLKIVNSAFFGFPAQISTISHAISIIGLKELENLVLGTLIIDKFSTMPHGLVSMKEFWEYSLRCGLLAKEISNFHKQFEVTETIFVCGILHEIGKLVFYRRIPALAREIGILVKATDISEIQAEEKLIGFDHYETGAALTSLWQLPEIICRSIKYHNNWQAAGEHQLACKIVRQASELSHIRIFDAETFEINDLFSEYSLDHLETIMQRANTHFDAVFHLFYPDKH